MPQCYQLPPCIQKPRRPIRILVGGAPPQHPNGYVSSVFRILGQNHARPALGLELIEQVVFSQRQRGTSSQQMQRLPLVQDSLPNQAAGYIFRVGLLITQLASSVQLRRGKQLALLDDFQEFDRRLDGHDDSPNLHRHATTHSHCRKRGCL